MSVTEVIEEQKKTIQRQAEQIASLSLLLLQYVEQEEIDRMMMQEGEK